MKKFVATLFITAILAVSALGQSDPPPTLRIVTESPGLPSELFYGNIKVKPLRFRPGTTTPITIADNDFYVQQQYIDFLRRFPESTPTGGLNYYMPILNACNGDTECLKRERGRIAANFFRSPEFGEKGLFIMALYMVSLGQRPATVAELSDTKKIERPHYTEFMADLQSISDPNDDKAVVSAKKDALTVAWLQRSEIQAVYGSLTNAQFLQKLVDTAGVTISNQSDLVAYMDARGGSLASRAAVLRNMAERQEVTSKFYKPAFVTMQYFGFLRRDPETCYGHPDPAQCGYIFHNTRFQLNVDQESLENGMVRGFTESPEYFNRF
jgi:hypothetical protein